MKQAALLSRALRFSSFSSFSSLSPVSAACLVLAALTALPALAQQNEAQAREARARGAKGDEAPTLPAVTVQARQVREKVQELPFTVNVLDEAQLEERRLTSLEDVLRGTPGVEVNSWGGVENANVRIRGVGSLYQGSSDDNSVIVNMDGAPVSVGNVGPGTLDVEQVEVLKGPQGTLFGRNSTAGAINIRTRKPQLGRWEGSARGEAGSSRQHLAEGVLNAPLGQQAAARLALRHSGQDYWYRNTLTGRPVSRPRDEALRASLLWQPQAATEVLLRASHHESGRYQNALRLRHGTGRYSDQELTSAHPLDDNFTRTGLYTLQVQHDFSGAQLTSVTSHERNKGFNINMTGREMMRLYMGVDMDMPQVLGYKGDSWNQDLRLSSRPGSRVFWVAGANALRRDSRNLEGRSFSVDADALYGETTWPVGASGLSLTAGLRHTRERKHYQSTQSTPAGVASGSVRERYTTGRAGLGWALSPQTRVYLTWARGHKSGGFSGSDFSDGAGDGSYYRPGRVDSVEAGLKHESADGRLRLDAALFHNRIKDDRMAAFNPATRLTRMVNVDTRSQGLEAQAHWRLGAGLTASGGLTWLRARIASGDVTTPIGVVRNGYRLPDVPRLSALLGLQWQRQLTAFWGLRSPALNARLTLRHVGRRAANVENSFDLGSYRKLDLRVGVSSGAVEVYLWADNLLNARYDLYGYYMGGGLQGGMSARGRSAGVGAVYFF